MLRTLIVDDEPLAHQVVLTYAKEVSELSITGQCYSGAQALSFLEENEVDLIFLDIQMPGLTGLDVLSVMKNKPQVIIASAYQEYALDGFNMDVTDYLLKPFRFDRFLQAIEKVRQRIKPSSDLEQAAKDIFIKVDRKQVKVELAQVSCLEAYGNYVKVWRNGTMLLTPATLSSFENSLPAKQFVRIHKSTIINLAHIDYISADIAKLRDGTEHAIGKQFKANLDNHL